MSQLQRTPLVILTRPGGKNRALTELLGDAGIETLVAPALTIHALPFSPGSLPQPADFDLIVFVTGSAAQIYLQLYERAQSKASWPSHTAVATVGVASAQPLYHAHYIPRKNILHPSPTVNQDSESLWALLQPRIESVRRALIVRGETGREWLGRQMEAHGVQVLRLPIYRRERAVWTELELQRIGRALATGQPLLCLLTSNESIDAVYENIERSGLRHFWRHARFIAIHERIASYLRMRATQACGTAVDPMVKLCTPADDAILNVIASGDPH